MPQVNVYNELGQHVGYVDASQVGNLAPGLRAATAAETQSLHDYAKYASIGGTLASGALGLAHGVTLGGSTALLGRTGLRGDIRKLQQYNPIAFGAGDIVGGIGGAALSFTPAGVAARAGLRAAGAAGARGAGLAGRFAAGAATEGALVGVGEGLARASLDNDLNGEKMMSSVLAGSLTGAAFGGGLGAIGQAGVSAARAGRAALARPVSALRSAGQAGYSALAGAAEQGAAAAKRGYQAAAAGAQDVGAAAKNAFQDGADLLTKEVVKPGRQAIQGVIDGAYDDAAAKVASKTADMYATAAGAMGGKDAKHIRHMLSKQGYESRKTITELGGMRERYVNDLADAIEDFEDAFSIVNEQVRRLPYKQKNLEKIMVNVDGRVAGMEASAQFLETLEIVRQMRGRTSRDETGRWIVDKAMKGNYRQTDLKKLEDTITSLWAGAAKGSDRYSAARQMRALDELKRTLGAITSRAKKSARASGGSYQDGNTARDLGNMHERLRLSLEDPKVWGSEAAAAQREINKDLTSMLATNDEYASTFLKRFGADPNDPWGKGVVADRARLTSYVDGLGLPKNTVSERALRETVEARARSVQSIRKHFKSTPEVSAAMDRALKASDKILSLDGTAAAKIREKAQWLDMNKSSSGLGVMAGAAAAGVGGLPGAVIAGALMEPGTVVSQLAALEAMARRHDVKVDEGVRAMFKDILSKPKVQEKIGAAADLSDKAKDQAAAAAEGAAALGSAAKKSAKAFTKEAKQFAKDASDMGKRTAGKVREAARDTVELGKRELAAAGDAVKEYGAAVVRHGARRGIKTVGAVKRYQDTRQEFNERSRKLLKFADDLPMMQQELEAALRPISGGAPKAHAVAIATAIRAIEYLDATLPGIRTAPHPFGRPPTVSLLEAERWLKRAAAIADPAMLLNEMARGKLSRESVDAVKHVYPKMFEELQTRVMDKVIEVDSRGQTIPYPKRKQLGILLEIPTDGTLQPQVIAQVMDSYGAAKEKDAKSKKANRAPRPKSQALAAAYSTDTQRMEATA